MRSEEVHSFTLHQTNEDIYGKTVTVLCWINIYAFSKFVDFAKFEHVQLVDTVVEASACSAGLCWRNGPLLSLFYSG